MKDKKIIIAIITIIVILGLILIVKNNKTSNNNNTGEDAYINKDISEKKDDTSAIAVEKDTKIENDKITKTGDSSDLSESDKTGKNSAVLVNTPRSLTIDNTEITTSGAGASGVAATSGGARVTINDTTITTNKERSKGLLASGGGTIDANNVNIQTTGDKSSGAVTDYGGGTLNITNSVIETTGEHSAGIYSTDNIIVENTKITTAKSTAAVIDGTGQINLTNCDLTSGGKRAIYIYYTGANAKDTIKGRFTMTGGSLNATNGPAFYVTNTTAIINIENVNLTAGTGIILNAVTDSSDLGMENAVNTQKGGDAVVTAKNQKLEGGFVVDKQSTLDLTLSNGSSLKGYINKENIAKKVKLTVESGCTIELTDNCYVNELDIKDGATVIKNGYKIIEK